MADRNSDKEAQPPLAERLRRSGRKLQRSLVLVGLMGAGKSAVGRRLAAAIGAKFRDSDDEIERAAAMKIPEIFEQFGERYFREGERRVIARMLNAPPHVLATGGGAFMAEDTRALLLRKTHVVWLRADLDTLVERCSRRGDRPLLQGADIKTKLAELIEKRNPVYQEAETIVDTVEGPHEAVVEQILERMVAAGDFSATDSSVDAGMESR